MWIDWIQLTGSRRHTNGNGVAGSEMISITGSLMWKLSWGGIQLFAPPDLDEER